MMIKMRSFWLLSFGALSPITFLAGCNDREPFSVNISAKYDPAFFGKDISVSLENKTDFAVCFLKRDLDPSLPNVKIIQHKTNLLPSIQSNREVVMFNGTNVSGGVEVVPRGTRNFFVSVSQFPLEKGPFYFAIQIKFAKCAEVFSSKKTEWHVLHGNVAGIAP